MRLSAAVRRRAGRAPRPDAGSRCCGRTPRARSRRPRTVTSGARISRGVSSIRRIAVSGAALRAAQRPDLQRLQRRDRSRTAARWCDCPAAASSRSAPSRRRPRRARSPRSGRPGRRRPPRLRRCASRVHVRYLAPRAAENDPVSPAAPVCARNEAMSIHAAERSCAGRRSCARWRGRGRSRSAASRVLAACGWIYLGLVLPARTRPAFCARCAADLGATGSAPRGRRSPSRCGARWCSP